MDAPITLGKDETGNLISVETQRSGKGDLVCPFCAAPLIAVRGALNAHHFRHDGDTCRESLGELPAIPGWDHFHLSLPAEVVQYLRQHRDGFDASDPLTRRLRSLGLISRNSYTGWDELSDTGKVVAGTLSLSKFDGWFRERLQARLSDKRALVDAGQLHPAHFEIEAWRQQQILSASLYVLEITAADGTVFHKVGRTRRDAQQRLAEVLQDVSTALQIHASARVLRTLPMAGYLEKFILWKHQASRRLVGVHQEYLTLDGAALRNLQSDLTRCENSRTPFSKAERFIASGRWRYEARRLEAVRAGIEKTCRNGLRFGRPKGSTTTGTDAYFKAHIDVVACLQRGHSLARSAALTGKSLSTVKRVKKALANSAAPGESSYPTRTL